MQNDSSTTSSIDTTLPRREFISLSTLALATSALSAIPANAMAGPFDASDFARLIPPDKKLRPEWVKSLFERGEPTVYSHKKNELRHIGMPVGGICTGTLYLGGDGKLWVWDIFNENRNGIQPRQVRWAGYDGEGGSVDPQNGANYVSPAEPRSPLEQGFALKVDGVTRPLHAGSWDEITFRGEYPIGSVSYTDPACPVKVTLTAYSPFIPLNADDSGLPLTLCEFTLHNAGNKAVDAQIGGWLENATSLFSGVLGTGERYNRVVSQPGLTGILSDFRLPAPGAVKVRPDKLVDDFDRAVWAPWTSTGVAFGDGPALRKEIPAYQDDLGGEGARVVNSHAKAPGNNVTEKDAQTGTLTSPSFLIERRYISFYIGGGAKIEEVGMRLMLDGKAVRRATGHDNNKMRAEMFDVQEFEGKRATLEIYDHGTGAWGNIGVAQIVQTDTPAKSKSLEQATDWGEMALVLLENGHAVVDGKSNVNTTRILHERQHERKQGTAKPNVTVDTLFNAPTTPGVTEAHKTPNHKLLGGVTRDVTLEPGKSETVTFAIAWRFPNSGLNVPDASTGNHYAKRFPTLTALLDYLVGEYPRLSHDTKLWHATWYDSTLPYWFLDRTFLNTSILATSTAHRFGSGRFWGWEGVGCCYGTCTHV